MKKTKLLMPLTGIATLGAIVPVVAMTSCNKNTSHIVEPTAEEKTKKPAAGGTKAIYSVTFNEEVKRTELNVSLKDISSNNENLIKVTDYACIGKECIVLVEWVDMPYETTTCSFTLSFEAKGWTQEVKKCSITYTQPTDTFKVTFKYSDVAEQTVKYSNHIVKPSDPTKEGYTFEGWYTDSTFAEEFDFDNERIFANTTIYPKWTSIGDTFKADNLSTWEATEDQLEEASYTIEQIADEYFSLVEEDKKYLAEDMIYTFQNLAKSEKLTDAKAEVTVGDITKSNDTWSVSKIEMTLTGKKEDQSTYVKTISIENLPFAIKYQTKESHSFKNHFCVHCTANTLATLQALQTNWKLTVLDPDAGIIEKTTIQKGETDVSKLTLAATILNQLSVESYYMFNCTKAA